VRYYQHQHHAGAQNRLGRHEQCPRISETSTWWKRS
jgi:hypothetical protein